MDSQNIRFFFLATAAMVGGILGMQFLKLKPIPWWIHLWTVAVVAAFVGAFIVHIKLSKIESQSNTGEANEYK